MRLPEIWTREVWARAAAPTIPAVCVVGSRMISDATEHRADYVGLDRWVVDFLPGRQLSSTQAKAALRIAMAPDRLEVDRWAALLGMTAAEVRGYAGVSV
ncbi:hypothetical protein ACQPZ2_44085 (plasmid) [Nocardia pseudovaccinii]|uniref:hypothetical protein n=1 Tax=Nocardia pseudovaccinii TaxID=189540 RepID=UPI003D8F71C9